MPVILIVMCGLQCSGKSTKAKQLAEEYGAVVVSSDAIRKLNPTWNNTQVFNYLYVEVNKLLNSGVCVIIDATNTTMKSRRQIFANIKTPCYKICHIMNTPYNTCLDRLKKRNALALYHNDNYGSNDPVIPEDILDKYYKTFEIPFYYEGWDEIELDNIIDNEASGENLALYLTAANGFNQRNKHHTQDLGAHMVTVGDYLKKRTSNKNLVNAGYYHDVGKLSTQTVGEDGDCHYYAHANVGAYNLMCCACLYDAFGELKLFDTLEWLFYINYHMQLKQLKTEKSITKRKRIFGEELYYNLKQLDLADNQRPNKE